jgi:TolA-binding protein
MIKFKVRCLFCLFLALLLSNQTFAQDEARAAWQVTNFDINVNSLGSERALNARAGITLRNVGRGAGSTATVRINSSAEIKGVTVGGATAGYRSLPDPRASSQRIGAQRLTINLPASVAPNDTVVVTIEYRLPVDENSGVAAISPVESQFLPASLWYPTPNTAFAVRGADYAPFHLIVANVNAISSGVEKASAGNSSFEQSLNGQPFFVTGNWDRVGSANAKGVSAFLPKGSGDDDRKQAQSLIDFAADARTFFATMFGPAADLPIRLVAVKRGSGFDDAGTILLSEGSFRRKKIDAATALGIAEAISRLWIGAATPVRGDGSGVLREGLARFLATMFIEKQFGADAASEERARERLAYAAIAKRDTPLSRTTQAEPTYFNSVGNKGAMVWRLAYQMLGRDAFIATVNEVATAGKVDAEGFSLARFRAALAGRGGSTLKTILDQELDQPTDMDLMVGLPQQQGGQWTAAVRNLGSFDVRVTVAATTSAGQRVTAEVTVPAHDFAQAIFQSPASLVRAEIDPDKLYPQIDYANDAAPRTVEVASSLAEAMRLFGTQEYAKAETLIRQLISAAPRLQEARVLLARALLAQKKTDEAEREFRQLADEKLPTAPTLAWTSIGLGEIALQRGQPKQAAQLFSEAIRADAEYGATLNARAQRVRAEVAAGSAPAIDQSAKTFIERLDAAIRSGHESEIKPLVVAGELARFIRGAAGTPAEMWQTRVVRTEQLDVDQMAVDVEMQTKQLGVEHSGTAVFILAKIGGDWKLNAIELFEVR